MTFKDTPTWALKRIYTRGRLPRQPGTEEPLDKNLLLPDRGHGDSLYIGDIYARVPTSAEMEWSAGLSKAPGPYLSHIKKIQLAFPHLRYLSNWMEVTTAPAKWDLLKDLDNLDEIRDERAHRVRAAAVDFAPSAEPSIRRINDLESLDGALSDQKALAANVHRLYVVEDLSREVIERLGFQLDIDPLFFREQISDYLWSNVQDPWVELPDLDIVSRDRPFFHLTYVQPRFFRNHAEFTEAQRDAGRFNVLRRIDDDSAHKAIFDKEGSVVALVRSKFSLWTRPAQDGRGAVAVLLVDPTIKAGFPLWKGYRPFVDSPAPSSQVRHTPAPTTESLLDNVLHWTRRMPAHARAEIAADPRVMAFRMLQIYCAEWLSVSRYIQARLGQIEWEIEREDFRHESQKAIGPSLAKLHTWRRRIPMYKTMVTQAHKVLFRRDRRVHPWSSVQESRGGGGADTGLYGEGEGEEGEVPGGGSATEAAARRRGGGGPGQSILDLREDFTLVSEGITELLSRTERIAAVATAVTAIEETQRAAEHNLQLGRLTYLAVIFAPLSFVSSFFSMTDNLPSLGTTFWVYFCVAVPMSLMVYLLVEKEWKAALRRWWVAVKDRAQRKTPDNGRAGSGDGERHYSQKIGPPSAFGAK
ncbi:uncharacterized protein B0I36DRAFT_351856 [Microdochium trichocladiopsis]|uniref:Uncharacterized protein n=1 Tax=Microdochium trichocladiopsis TaxID=1682393 RepID=A0A9P9BJT4_9PEZI|nr:uncharacterized protein B0I36DRAFT_351856 [Microdochium trichocladiopsis]KAH7025914.1 hypothetical protein B0I36DRAFT_351856 [Microdochium trichocladiopsis]